MYQFADTFDHYTDPATMYEHITGTPIISSSYVRFPAIGSFPNQGMKLHAGSDLIRKNLKSNQGTLIAFMSYGGQVPSSNLYSIMEFYDNGTMQCYLAITSTGGWVVRSGPGFGSEHS